MAAFKKPSVQPGVSQLTSSVTVGGSHRADKAPGRAFPCRTCCRQSPCCYLQYPSVEQSLFSSELVISLEDIVAVYAMQGGERCQNTAALTSRRVCPSLGWKGLLHGSQQRSMLFHQK